jgi:hypothetical protein
VVVLQKDEEKPERKERMLQNEYRILSYQGGFDGTELRQLIKKALNSGQKINIVICEATAVRLSKDAAKKARIAHFLHKTPPGSYPWGQLSLGKEEEWERIVQ